MGHFGGQKGGHFGPWFPMQNSTKMVPKQGPKLALYTDFRVRFISTAALKTGQVLGPLLHLFLAKNGPKTGRFGAQKGVKITLLASTLY